MTFVIRRAPPELFKYLEPQWADAMIDRGSIRIGTLADYRRDELHGAERGDAGEGTRIVESDSGPQTFTKDTLPDFIRGAIAIEGGGTLVVDAVGPAIVSTTRIPDIYVYSTTAAFDAAVMRNFGEACVRIFDPVGFF